MFPVMTSEATIIDGGRFRVGVAMAMSRSVIMPTAIRSGPRTTMTPQSFSYIAAVTRARSSVTPQQTGFAVIMSRTFIVFPLSQRFRRLDRALGQSGPESSTFVFKERRIHRPGPRPEFRRSGSLPGPLTIRADVSHAAFRPPSRRGVLDRLPIPRRHDGRAVLRRHPRREGNALRRLRSLPVWGDRSFPRVRERGARTRGRRVFPVRHGDVHRRGPPDASGAGAPC